MSTLKTTLSAIARALLWPVAMVCLLGAGVLDAIEGEDR
jgi:hypothetical protein